MTNSEKDTRKCANCGKDPTEGNYSIHRDGFGIGPEVPLCDGCGSGELPTCREIWDNIAESGRYKDEVDDEDKVSMGCLVREPPCPICEKSKTEFTLLQVLEMLDEEHHPTIRKWLDRGDGVAVYQNVAFDSGDFGHKKFVSFGSKAAQLETDDPPTRLPDIGGQINWKYQLVGTYRK